jgi:hypothetical protein
MSVRVESTDKLAVLAGPLYTPAPDQDDVGFYGTDLGVAFEHQGELRILFGDTWRDASGALIGGEHDDAQGVISLQPAPDGFPDGDAVDAFLASQPLAADQPWWQRAAPPVTLQLEAGETVPFELHRATEHGTMPVDFGIGRAVVAAFSNGGAGAFAIFRRDVPVQCSGGAMPSCEDGFVCDRELGVCANDLSGEYASPCLMGGKRCPAEMACVAVEGGGFCQDRTSSLYADDEDGRVEAVVIQHEVGRADPSRPIRYVTQPFVTNKFTNPIAKVVRDFDPDRGDPTDNDYRRIQGAGSERAKVLLWGRPRTAGTKQAGRDARLYFAYVDVPFADASGDFAWRPHYFAGLEDGRPRYSDRQVDAVALDLNGAPNPEAEAHDIVDRTAVTYVESLGTWAMFYGGDFAPFFLRLWAGPGYQQIARHPQGAIHARFASHPWGPWSAPVSVLEAGDPNVSPPDPNSEYGPLGMLHHPACTASDCIAGEPSAPSHLLAPYGFLYGPNIFDPWTEVRDEGNSVDLYWNVSTWSPYQVVLLRTRIVR